MILFSRAATQPQLSQAEAYITDVHIARLYTATRAPITPVLYSSIQARQRRSRRQGSVLSRARALGCTDSSANARGSTRSTGVSVARYGAFHASSADCPCSRTRHARRTPGGREPDESERIEACGRREGGERRKRRHCWRAFGAEFADTRGSRAPVLKFPRHQPAAQDRRARSHCRSAKRRATQGAHY